MLLPLFGIILSKNIFSILAPSVINIGNKLINPILRLRNANHPKSCLNQLMILSKIWFKKLSFLSSDFSPRIHTPR